MTVHHQYAQVWAQLSRALAERAPDIHPLAYRPGRNYRNFRGPRHLSAPTVYSCNYSTDGLRVEAYFDNDARRHGIDAIASIEQHLDTLQDTSVSQNDCSRRHGPPPAVKPSSAWSWNEALSRPGAARPGPVDGPRPALSWWVPYSGWQHTDAGGTIRPKSTGAKMKTSTQTRVPWTIEAKARCVPVLHDSVDPGSRTGARE